MPKLEIHAEGVKAECSALGRSVPIWKLTLLDPSGVWEAAYATPGEANAFLAGVTAAAVMFGLGEVPPILVPTPEMIRRSNGGGVSHHVKFQYDGKGVLQGEGS